MGCMKWRRNVFRKKVRRLLVSHRDAVRALVEAQLSLKSAQAYHPVCLGGLEDRFAWIDQAEVSVALWWREREHLEKKLKATDSQTTRLRKIALKREEKES